MTHLPTRRRTAVVSSVCLTVALLGVAPSAWAAETNAASADAATAAGTTSSAVSAAAQVDASSTVALDVTSAEAADAVAYWTPERRAAALDADAGTSPADPGSAATSDPVTTSAAASSAHATQIAPVSHIGRIFYTQDGAGYACSANVVVSANRSTIATAGHCLTQRQVFSTNIVFYPGYDSGESQYGTWPVIRGYVPTGWYQGNDADQGDDSGFLAVQRDASGNDIQSVVGASPVLFDQPGAERAAAYGYPAEGRFDGQTLQRCVGQGEAVSAEQIALPCDMTGGVSGGPILAGDSLGGAQFANVAEKYEDESHNLGPVWKDVEHSAYDLTAAVAN